jgi:hypothetical protein
MRPSAVPVLVCMKAVLAAVHLSKDSKIAAKLVAVCSGVQQKIDSTKNLVFCCLPV